MDYCCCSCFKELSIFEFVRLYGEQRNEACYYCGSSDVSILAVKLQDILEKMLDGLKPSDDGNYLFEIFSSEFKLFNEGVADPHALCEAILGEEINNETYSLKYDSHEYAKEWENFKKEIIDSNRFFPQNSIYALIFSDNSSSVGTLFQRLLGELGVFTASNDSYFRARISEEALSSTEMGAPPLGKASAGRANPVGISYLYVAEDIETAVHEVRPSNASIIRVSSCRPEKKLKLLDLIKPRERVKALTYEEHEIEDIIKLIKLLELFSVELSKPIQPYKSHLDYIPTQFICEYIKTIAKFDGIKFRSSFRKGNNVVVFDPENFSVDEPEPHEVVETNVISQRIE